MHRREYRDCGALIMNYCQTQSPAQAINLITIAGQLLETAIKRMCLEGRSRRSPGDARDFGKPVP